MAGGLVDDGVYERLLRERIVVLGQEIDDTIANQISAQLLLLAAEDPLADVTLYINSPGGSVSAAMAIYDSMAWIEPDVSTVAMGLAAGMAGVLLAAGSPGKRLALPHAQIMVSEPSGGAGGTETDPVVRADALRRLRQQIVEIVAGFVGQPETQVAIDLAAYRWFDAQEALAYGYVDRVVDSGAAARTGGASSATRRENGDTATVVDHHRLPSPRTNAEEPTVRLEAGSPPADQPGGPAQGTIAERQRLAGAGVGTVPSQAAVGVRAGPGTPRPRRPGVPVARRPVVGATRPPPSRRPRRRLWDKPLAWAVVGFLLLAVSPVATLALVAWGLLLVCRRHLHATHTRAAPAKNFRYHLAEAGRLYLPPIAVALTLWVGLWVSMSWAIYRPDVGSLVTLQETLGKVSEYFSSTIKLSEPGVFGGLVVAYLVTAVLLARPGARRAGPNGLGHRFARRLWQWTDGYTRYSGPVASGLATLAAISVLGAGLGPPSEALALRVRTAESGYAELARRVEAALTERVTTDVYARIWNALPPMVRAATAVPTTLDGDADALRRHADDVWSDKHVDVPVVDQDLQRQVGRVLAVQRLDDVLVSGPPHVDAAPTRLTESGLSTARAGLDAHPDNGILLVDEGRKKVYLQIEKIVTERIAALTKPLTAAVPLLDPLVQTLLEALDGTLQSRIAASYDRAMSAAVDQPENLSRVIDDEADRLARTTTVEPLIARHAGALEAARASLEQQRGDLAEERATLDRAAADVPHGRPAGRHIRTPVPNPFPPGGAIPPRPPSLHLPGVPDAPPAPEVHVPVPEVHVPVPEVHVPKIPRIPIFF